MKILVVIAHGRQNSLTHAAAAAFADGAKVKSHEVEVADLVAEGFDPVLRVEDEPDWNDPAKAYSTAVRREMERIERNQATVIFFPVWWWSMPAILKGWIDRVWNHGWAYGGRNYPHAKVLMVAIAGNGRESYEKRHYDVAMQTQISTGILGYCGVTEGRLEILQGVLEDTTAATEVVATAARLGRAWE